MANRQDRILIVETDPAISDLIANQALSSQGYSVIVVKDAAAAIAKVESFSPDVVITNHKLPDLSGKDLVAALSSQGVQVPVIIIASPGEENEVIRAFRLGALGCIYLPIRETEVIAAVERALRSVRVKRESRLLRKQVEFTSEELHKRIKDLTTLFEMGKVVTMISDHQTLFNKLMESAVKITESDNGSLLLLDEHNKRYVKVASYTLPQANGEEVEISWKDGNRLLEAGSGDSLGLYGKALKQYKLTAFGNAGLMTPVLGQDETIALLLMFRKADREYTPSDQAMLEVVGNYLAISLLNTRLFSTLQDQVSMLQLEVRRAKNSEKNKGEIINLVTQEIMAPLLSAKEQVDMLASGKLGKLIHQQVDAVFTAQRWIVHLIDLVGSLREVHELTSPKKMVDIDLNKLVEQIYNRWEKIAKDFGIKLLVDASNGAIKVTADIDQMNIVFDTLLATVIKLSTDGGELVIKTDTLPNYYAHISFVAEGKGIGDNDLDHIFEHPFRLNRNATPYDEKLASDLVMVKDIIVAHDGKIWVETSQKRGITFHFTLPPNK